MKAITGYVGVIAGEPVFEEFSDDKGDASSIDLFRTKREALERWARVQRVRLEPVGEVIEQPSGKGRI